MPYDPQKDVLVHDFGSIALSERVRLTVQIRAYDGGAAKLCLTERGTKKNGEPWNRPLGRFALEHTDELGRYFADAARVAISAAIASSPPPRPKPKLARPASPKAND